MLFHIVEKQIFNDYFKESFYANPSLLTRGFIHSVTIENIEFIAQRYLQLNEPVVILMIDENYLDN